MENLHPQQRYAKSDLEALRGASHGLTKGQLEKVYETQKQGGKFEQIAANMESTHMINEHEKFVYHVRVTRPQFDPTTGKDESRSRIDKFPPLMFKQCKESGIWDGVIVEILHDPSRYQNKDGKGKFSTAPNVKILD